MKKSTLFTVLPDYICTPDGMAIDSEGNLILSCPNYADDNISGCVAKIDKDKNITKWFDVPTHRETGVARNMGITLDVDQNVYLCDNQGWSGADELMYKGRILKVKVTPDGEILKTTVVAKNMEHPNGIRIWGNYMYVTQSSMSKVNDPSGKLVSCVYKFNLNDEDIDITNTLADKNILTTFLTHNMDCQYGVDGIVFDKQGNLFIGNFGDGEVIKLTFNVDGSLATQKSFAKNPQQLNSTDGMIMDDDGNIYIADFSKNAIGKVSPDGSVERIAESPDCDGLGGGLDQPGEPIIWDGKLIISCFDLVTDDGKVNIAHQMPATLAQLEL